MRARELLAEAYQDRLEQAAQFVLQRYGSQSVDKSILQSALERFAATMPLGSVKPSEFVQDAIKHLGNRIKIQRKTPAASERNQAFAELNVIIPSLAQRLLMELGNIFPDGDPYDVTELLVRRFSTKLRNIQMALGDYGNLDDWFHSNVWPRVLKEFKKQNSQDVYDYLADLWDEQRAQNHHDYEHGHAQLDPAYQGQNPYRSSR